MGYTILNQFDTRKEAVEFKLRFLEDNPNINSDDVIIFDDKNFSELGKRFSVNLA